MRVRLKLDQLHDLMARGNLSQNHWAIKIGISRGHWSEVVNGKHIHPSPKTRERLLEVFGVPFDELFEIELDAPGWSDPTFQAAISDRYLIDEEIGHGGMGTVYLARDVKLGRPVAIKVLAPEAVSGIGVQQFLKEARYTARLQHQNVLGLYDAGEAAGHPYYVMPYIKGGSLRQLLERRGRLPLDEALRIAAGIASALDYAHRNHVLHCDVKPENILVTEDHVYVADFGISRAIHAEVHEWGRREGIDSSAGTPAYVSPEQASGERNLDARSDVYSFSCVLFEMLAGRAPFTGGNTEQIVAQRFTKEAPDLRSLAPEVPHAVSATIERAMALVRERRTATASQFIREMERAASSSRLVQVVGSAAFVLRAMVRRTTGRAAGRPHALATGRIMEGVTQDLRQAIRSLRRVPAFAAMATLTLALGIGANAAIFMVVNAVMLQPLPYDRPDELVMMWELDRLGKSGGADTEWTVAPANYVAWQERANTLSDIAAFNYWRPTLSGDGPSERLAGSVMTPNMLNLLGVAPILGSGFTPEHGVPGNTRVVLLGYGLWQRRFGGDPNVIGRTIRLSGTSYSVLGVMPEHYRHPEPHVLGRAQIWRPIAWESPESNYSRHLRTVARMKPGVTLETAQQNIAAVSSQLEIEFAADDGGWGVVMQPLREELFGDVRTALLMLLGGAGFVLLIVCANVANLVLARSHGRRKEFAIRTSLGAGRKRLARQLIAESVLLTAGGGIIGVAAVRMGTGFLHTVQDLYISSVADIRVDGTVVAFTMVLALATGIIFGVLPVLQSSRTDLRTALTEESAGAGVTRRTRKLRSGLVVAEVLLATVLAVGAGLMARSFATLIGVPTGFDSGSVLTFGITLPSTGYENADRIRAYHAQLLPRLSGLPGVEQAALVSDLPFTTENRFLWVKPAVDLPPSVEWTLIEYRKVGPGYFGVMGIDLISGRDLRSEDRGQGENIAVVINQRMAERFWPDQDPLGRRFPVGDFTSAATIVGVVADILDDGFDSEPEPRFYYSFGSSPRRYTDIVMRTNGNPMGLASAASREAEALESEVLASGFRAMDEIVDETTAEERIALTLAAAFSLLALVLAAVGIYGVMSYAVGERQREIGVRTALGAQRSDVMKLILGHSGRLTLLGTAGGLLLALPLARLLSAFLFGVRWMDPIALGVAPVMLGAVALVASYIPAARATRISPVEALRSER